MHQIKRLLILILVSLGITQLTACVVEPIQPVHYAVRPAPYYPSPGEGWEWREHHEEGWGWYHPNEGWHRGWR